MWYKLNITGWDLDLVFDFNTEEARKVYNEIYELMNKKDSTVRFKDRQGTEHEIDCKKVDIIAITHRKQINRCSSCFWARDNFLLHDIYKLDIDERVYNMGDRESAEKVKDEILAKINDSSI